MTVNELIERLEEIRGEADENGEAEVRLLTQPAWPFEWTIAGVCTGQDINDVMEPDELDEPNYDDDDASDETTVFICEGTQMCYGSKRGWDVCRG